jgi:hypothetical protein
VGITWTALGDNQATCVDVLIPAPWTPDSTGGVECDSSLRLPVDAVKIEIGHLEVVCKSV